MEYGLKYHTTTADNMSTAWLGPRLYQAKLEEVLVGALSPVTPHVHYVDLCPLSLVRWVCLLSEPAAETDARSISATNWWARSSRHELHFANGVVAGYDAVVSSIPLTELIPMIAGAPPDVVEAAKKLACSSCVMVNLGINRTDLSEGQWTYFYDRGYLLSRGSASRICSRRTHAPRGAAASRRKSITRTSTVR